MVVNFIKLPSTKKHIKWISETLLSYVPIRKFNKHISHSKPFKKGAIREYLPHKYKLTISRVGKRPFVQYDFVAKVSKIFPEFFVNL